MSERSTWIQRIEEVLRTTAPPDDPTRVHPERWRVPMPAGWQQKIERGLRPAAVLMPFLIDAGAERLLLTRRADTLRYHQGQVSFPGGSLEPDDASVTDAALRETEEEVGVPRTKVDVLGYLPTQPTITGFAVTPVVGRIDAPVSFRLDPVEVAEIFEVPLEFIFADGNMRVSDRTIDGVRVPVYEWQYREQRIWGATAWMLKQMVDMVTQIKQ